MPSLLNTVFSGNKRARKQGSGQKWVKRTIAAKDAHLINVTFKKIYGVSSKERSMLTRPVSFFPSV